MTSWLDLEDRRIVGAKTGAELVPGGSFHAGFSLLRFFVRRGALIGDYTCPRGTGIEVSSCGYDL